MSDEAKHTPAPWRALIHPTRRHQWIIEGNGVRIAMLECEPGDGEAEEALRADAKLIAAAPAMKEALERMVGLIEKLMPSVPWGKTWNTAAWLAELNEAPMQAKTALAKTTEEDR